jgi:uncharacterized membrane protein YedE/YeeE
MKENVVAFGAGLTFSVGLAISGMTQPNKVIGFLDVAGAWDPSLAFVMMGAVGVGLIAFRSILKRSRPIFGAVFELPRRKDIDARLVAGAALFGVGWGIAGYCPGPALVSLATGHAAPILFVAAMIAGFGAQRISEGFFGVSGNEARIEGLVPGAPEARRGGGFGDADRLDRGPGAQ